MEVTATTTRRRHNSFRRLIGREAPLGYLLILPLLLVMVGLLAYPVVSALLISFQDKRLGQPGSFIGLDNYTELLFRDRRFRIVARNSFVFTFGSVLGKLLIGMGMALVLNQRIKARNIFRGWLLLPWVAPTFVTALTWRWMFDGTSGVLNFILAGLGLLETPVAWLGSGSTALLAVIITNIWHGFPFFGISLLAALQAIPAELYEAAEVDGASPWQKFWHITIPGIMTVLVIVTMLSTIWTFNDFQIVYIMTGGGPAFATHIFATYSYFVGFSGSRLGYAVAISTVLTPALIVLILALSPLLLRGERE
ncbi:MAG TPA: sugar ABC transporter permease [Roseiflexaceae bacterium]|nr:sugar ABC transporter permease [Roseiflexaceae bacterium]